MKMLPFLLSAMFPLLVIAAEPTTKKSAAPPAVGEKAAEFALDTLDGKTVRLSELNKNGPVILLQLRGWVGYQCPICTQQVGEFLTHAKEISAIGARVVLVYPPPADTLNSMSKTS